jgi:heat shock protein HslJ
MKTKTIHAIVLAFASLAIASTTTIAGLNPGGQNSSGLAGTSWQLVKFQGGDNTTLVPDDKSKYSITFGSDGRVQSRVDCNRGHSTWRSSGAGELRFGSWSMTRAKCPPGSLHDRIVTEGASVRSYIIKDGHLFLSGMEAGGFYELEPIKTQKRRSSRRGGD